MAIHEILANKIENLEESWQNHTGQEVEDFITRQLIDTLESISTVSKNDITGITYENSTLTLIKENGTLISTTVTVENPTYDYGIYIYGIMLDNDTNKIYTEINQDLIMQYTPNRNVKVGIAMYAIASTSFSTSNRPGPFEVKIQFGSENSIFNVSNIKYEDCIIDSGEGFISGVVGTTEEIINKLAWVDVTKLFTKALSGIKLMATVINNTKKTDTLNLNITNEVITLSYNGEYVINSNQALFSLQGATGNYYLEIFNNGNNKETTSSGSLVYNNLLSGLNQLAVRAVNSSDSSICSDYLYIDIISTLECSNTVIAINGVKNNIENNGVATLYELIVYSTKKEEVSLTTYLEEEVDFINPLPTNIMKYEILGASSYNENNLYETYYKKYIEISANNSTMYLLIKFDDSFYKFYNVNNDRIYSSQYKIMTVEQSDKNLSYYSEIKPSYNFDQIQGYINNVFITDDYATPTNPSNIISTLESSDGWKEDDGRAIFKVSAQDTPIFKNPINLGLTTTCTIEMGVKTYNISDKNNPILTIGNFLLRPTQFCWNTSDNTLFAARNSLFREGVETHIMVTIQKGWSVSKSDIYYPDYLPGDYQTSYDEKAGTTLLNLVRIYINGVIDREINLSDTEIQNLTSSTLQINPTTSDVDFYLFRIYNNVALNFKQVQQNYISFLSSKSDKINYYNNNDILGDNGEISFEKCLNKYNTLVYVFPKGGRFPNRSWGGEDGNAEEDVNKKLATTLFVNYADAAKNKIYGGRLTHGQTKGQGSSAMRYLIWNITYALNKLKYESQDGTEKKIKSTFTPYSELDDNNVFKENSSKTEGYYLMPPYNDLYDTTPYKYEKMVGKVNFASSMQSHKVGACKLFDDAYKKEFTKLPSGGRKAVHEEPFLYFYWESDYEYDSSEQGYNDPEKSPIINLSLSDLLTNNDKIKFMGFLTWGPGKGDDACSGYSDYTPEYLMLEGGENTDPSVNFRVPWLALQRGLGTLGTATYKLNTVPTISYDDSLNEPWSNLLIEDESIVYDTRGAWDIDYGCEEIEPEEAGLSNYFIFSSDVHESLKKFRSFYDFVYTYNFNLVITSDKLPNENWDTHKKYVVTGNSFSINSTGHKPGDMYRYNEVTKEWVCAGFNFNLEKNSWERINIYELTDTPTGYIDQAIDQLKLKFKTEIGNYVSIDDIAFHQAFIKFLSGTDNRAKNTYFLIIGKILKDEGELIDSGEGDYLIRLIGDDLDTIMVTDNNGLLSKPYNLLEASYDPTMKSHWGDAQNSFFYMFDLCFEEDIIVYLTKILETTLLDRKDVLNNNSYFYRTFFKVLNEDFPAVAYNHLAKIYYENAQSIKNSKVLSYYGNNNIEPIEQSHGSCLQCEALFLKERLDFLAGYAKTILGTEFVTASSAGTGDSLRLKLEFEPYQDFYPTYKWESTLYLGELLNSEFNCIKYQAKTGNTYNIELSPGGTAINQGLYQTDLFKTLKITGLKRTSFDANLDRNTSLYIDNDELNNYNSFFGSNYPELSIALFESNSPVLETLTLKNTQLPETLNCSNYLKLNTIDLTGSITSNVVLPQTGKLHTLILPETIKTFEIYNNPGLLSVAFEGYSNIEKVYIDCSKCGQFNVEEFCESLKSVTALREITLVNASNLKMTESTMSILSSKKCRFIGTFLIVDDIFSENLQLVAISFETKKQLVNNFGNITDPSNETYIEYLEKPIYNIECQELINLYLSSGEELASFENAFGLVIDNGNDVKILSNEVNPYNSSIMGRLDINYSIVSNSKVSSINPKTGVITITGSSTEEDIITITVNTTSNSYTVTCTLICSWIPPQIGDFAYADGTFSSAYNKSKTLVGMVYDKTSSGSGDSETGTAYIIGKEFSHSDTLYSGVNFTGGNSSSTNSDAVEINKLKVLLDNIISNYDIVSGINSIENVLLQITPENKTQIYNLSKTGKEDTLRYVLHVSNFLNKLKQDNSSYNSYYNTNTDEIESHENLILFLNKLVSDNYLSTKDTTSTQDYMLNKKEYNETVLYPYFYSIYLYEPSVTEEEYNAPEDTKFKNAYKKTNWYAPSLGELANVLYKRGISESDSFNNNNLESGLSLNNISNNDAIFAKAKSKMGEDMPLVWVDLFNDANNIITSINSTATDNYGYIVYYNSSSYIGEWSYGSPDSDITGNWTYAAQARKNLWRLTKHGGIPFTLYEYAKPSN